jgi:beta-glucanase (GH16 family)
VLPAIAALVLACLPAPAASAALLSLPCGGKRPLKPGGGFYKCTFDDEFNGSTLDGTKWYPQTTAISGFHSGAECFMYSPDNIAVGGGVLSLTVRKEAAPFTCATPTGGYTTQYTSGTVNTVGRFSQTYGRFEIRAKFPASTVAGLQSSLWMLSTSNEYGTWPTTGEIDIAEEYSRYPDRAIPYVHYSPVGGVDPNATNNYCLITANQFHTYVLQWTTSTISITFDGRTCVNDNWNPAPPLVKPAPFDQPFLIALTQALGVSGNAVNDATQLPATTQIDYVRVWS